MQKTLAVIIMAASLTTLGAVAAQAADTYPAPAPQSAVSQGSVLAGGTVTFSGHGFKPGERISITVSATGGQGGTGGVGRSVSMLIPALETQSVTTTADADGAFTVDLVLPQSGVYALTAVGSVSGVTTTDQVMVEAAPAAAVAAQSELPRTGADATLLAWSLVGAGALAAGITSVAVVRRRTREAS